MALRKIKPKSESDMFGPSKKQEDKKIFPHFSIDNTHLPEAKDWEVGKEYLVTLKLKMTGFSNSRFQKNSEYDIVGIDPKGKAKNSTHNSDHKED